MQGTPRACNVRAGNKGVYVIEVLQLHNFSIATVDPLLGQFFVRDEHLSDELSFVEPFLRAKSNCVGIWIISIHISIAEYLVNFLLSARSSNLRYSSAF